MNRQEKISVIESLRSDFARSKAAFLINVQGLSVGQIQKLRIEVRKEGGKLCVAKNTLARKSIQASDAFAPLHPFLKQQVALVFASEEPSAIARVLSNYTKEVPAFSITTGCFESQLMDRQMVAFLGSLPSREVLFAQLVQALQMPMVSCLSALNGVSAQCVQVLEQIAQS